ncbi:SRPBCC family protein [Arcticibacter tournemirensis]
MKNNKKDLLITHLFDAPAKLVFDAWTDPEHLKHWYAPDGCTVEFKSIDVKVGGQFHSCIHHPEHGDCWIKGRYYEVIVPEKLVLSMILSNENGETVSAPDAGKPDDWPLEIITTITFSPVGKQTKVTLHQTVAEAEAKKTGAYQSWFSMFNRLQEILNNQTMNLGTYNEK